VKLYQVKRDYLYIIKAGKLMHTNYGSCTKFTFSVF
jgi:hypothetical protein